MSIDVVDLRDFYANRLGSVARHFIGRAIRRRWSDAKGLRMVGLGYATRPSAASPSCRRRKAW